MRWLTPVLVGMLWSTSAQGAAVVTSELVCKVQHAIRWKKAPWTEKTCERVAQATNAAAREHEHRPGQLLAMQIVESNLQPDAVRWTGTIVDGGLMGVRCHADSYGYCTNGIVKGLTVVSVLTIETNIALGAELLRRHGSLRAYNGAKKKKTAYPEKIEALEAAFVGEVKRTKSKRVNALVGQIVAAVSGGVS